MLAKLLQLQLTRFIIVGSTAALVNFLGVWGLVAVFSLAPLLANLIAYIVASSVSYLGHYHWTFTSNRQHKTSVIRFYILLAINFCLNESLFALFLHGFHLDYRLALFVTLLIIPLFTFVASKFWVYG
jgi:putative flippase GtrA